MKHNLKTFFLVAVFFFSIFNLKFSFFPIDTQRIVAVIGFFHIFFSLTFCSRKPLLYCRSLLLPLVCFILFFAYCSFCYILQDSSDNSMVVSSSLILLQVYSSVFYLLFLSAKFNIGEDDFLKIISIVFFIQACAIIGFFVSAQFRNVVSVAIPLQSNSAEELTIRSRGFTHGGGALLGLLQGMGALFSFHIFYFSETFADKLKYAIYFTVISISIVLSGRTGFLIFPILLLVFTCFSLYYRDKTKFLIKYTSLASYSFFTISLFLIAYKLFFSWDNRYGNDGLLTTLQWAFGEFIDFNTNRYSDKENWATLKALFGSHVYFPESFHGWLLGESGSWISMNPHGDMGYIRILYTNGLLGSFLLYGGYFSIFVLSFWKARKKFKILFVVLFIYLYVAEIKEPFFLKFSVPTVCLLLFMYVMKVKQKLIFIEKTKDIPAH